MIWPFRPRRALAAAAGSNALSTLTPEELRIGAANARRRLAMLTQLYDDTHPEVVEARQIAGMFEKAVQQ